MRKLNPLYIIVLLGIVFIFVEYNLSQSKKELQDNFLQFQKNKELAIKLHTLKKAYSSENISKLLRILHSKRFASAHFNIDRKRDRVRITSKNISLKDLNYLFSKLLNGHYPIGGLELTRLSKEKAKMVLELVW